MSNHSASILIVEDEELSRDLIGRRLEDDGHYVTSCGTGKQALELIKIEKFDIILLDIKLPDINGIDVLDRIRKNPKLDAIHVMMVSASGDRETVLKCIEIGATDYLVKPFSMLVVKTRIQRCLNHEYLGIIQSHGHQYINDASILLVDDEELNREILVTRLQKSGYTVTCAANGDTASALIGTMKFDLVLLDIMMPDISGIEVLKELRKSGPNTETAVIMLTAVDDNKIINECMEAGADDYIMKPFNSTLLKIRVSSCIRSREALNQTD